MKEGRVSRPLSTPALHSISHRFTYFLQQRRRAVLAGNPALSVSVGFTYGLWQLTRLVLAGHSEPPHYIPLLSDSLTACSSDGRQCQPTTRRPGTTFHLARIRLLPTVVKEGSVSRPLSTQAPLSTSVGFTHGLQHQRGAVLASHPVPRHYTFSRSGSLTACSSEGGQC